MRKKIIVNFERKLRVVRNFYEKERGKMSKKEMLDHMKDLEAMCTNVCLDLWNHPETGGNEKRSADLMRELLTKEGFTITNNEHLPHALCRVWKRKSGDRSSR